MPQVVVESTDAAFTVRVIVVEISAVDGIHTLVCSGDPHDECPAAGFEPGDTWGNGVEDCLRAAVAHVAAHEDRDPR